MLSASEILELAQALANDETIYDKENHLVYIPDVNDEGVFYGIQIYHLSKIGVQQSENYQHGITGYCLGYIPAPGSAGINECGFSKWYGFDIDTTLDNEVLQECKLFVSNYLDSSRSNYEVDL